MKKIISIALCLLMFILVFTGCASTTDKAIPSATGKLSDTKLTGKVSLSGSTSMEEVVKAMQEAFMQNNPGVTVDAQFNGSGQGIKDASEGKADIGNSSRELTPQETGLTPTVIAIDGIVIIVNKANTVKDLSADQLAKIYTGEIKNWSEVGGKTAPIVVIGRDAASGTRGAFEELLKIANKCKYAQEKDSTGGIKTTVQSTPDAIGYVSLESADSTVTKLTLDGVEANEANIVSKQYKLARPFLMVTKEGTIKPEVKAFLDFVKSDEGQAIVKSLKLITVK